MCQSFLAVKAKGLEPAVTEHLEDLGILLTFFFEGQFALFVVIFVLAAATIFASLEKWVSVEEG
jgi:hypothetical protein